MWTWLQNPLRLVARDVEWLRALSQSVDKLIFKWDTVWFKLDKAQEVAARTGKRPQINTKCCRGPKVMQRGVTPCQTPSDMP